MPKPVIAITKPYKKEHLAYAAVAAAVKLCGGIPVALTPTARKERLLINGFLLGGGQDIFPMLYDATPKQGYAYDCERDAIEISAANQAREDDIPALGICRGAQLINVVRGGSLHADVSAEYEDAAYPNGIFDKAFYRKRIDIEPGSRLSQIVGEDTIEVNSLHKQAIKKLGDGLRATAKEKNGVIQTIEDEDLAFFMGVQFHPEFLVYREDMRALFGALIDAASSRDPVEVRKSDPEAQLVGRAVEHSLRSTA